MGCLTIACLSFVVVASEAPASVEIEMTSPPIIDGKPIEVSISFYALDFARITSREESFDVTGYFEMTWHDPRLAIVNRSGVRKNQLRRIDPARVWTPKVFFRNAIEQPKYHNDTVLEVNDQGDVTNWAILSGKFSARMDLRGFPFDREVLPVRVGAVDDDTIVKFAINRDLVRIGHDAFVTDWTIGRPSARLFLRQYETGKETYSRFLYEVPVARRATFYIWRVMLPLTLLAMVSFAAFWFEPVGLQPQISTCMSSLIALVAFNFSIDFSLPKVAYLTLIDKHALIGFGFVSAAVAMVTVIHIAVSRDRIPLALSIQRVARWVFPSAYAAAVALNMCYLLVRGTS